VGEEAELWERFGDLLQETPEAEEALRKWRDGRTRECRLAVLEQRRKRSCRKAFDSFPGA